LKFLLALNRIPGLGSKRLEALLNAFGSGERVWQASPRELMKVPSIGKNLAYAVAKARSSIDPDDEMKMIKSMGISLLSLKDEGYPINLKNIYDPPILLYIKGQLETRDLASIAVVGSRKASSYGRRVARRLSTQLVENSVTVVSGLARGIDTEAHRGALEGGGRTIAVMGSGLDVIYPPENERLFEAITRSGAVVSEFPPGTPPEARNFPARNRIISGLSFGTVVVEAREGSGSLITANFALEQGREVFAVPGDIYRWGSRGTNGLIKDGAKLVESVQDILEEISFFDYR
jgi:DNA processing protein